MGPRDRHGGERSISKAIRVVARPSLVLVIVIAVAASIFAALAPEARAIEKVDLELILAIDVSASVDLDEAKLQRRGYVAALANPRLIRAIAAGHHGRIAIAYFEWSGVEYTRIIADWSVVFDTESALDLLLRLANAPVATANRTSISHAIAVALAMFDSNSYEGSRRVLDISGDGANNVGGLVNEARDLAVAAGITINGLPVMNRAFSRFGGPTVANLDLYYESCVIGGPGAFIVVADDFDDIERAIRRKLILEIAGRTAIRSPVELARRWSGRNPDAGPGVLRTIAAHRPPPCNVGERLFDDVNRP
jgi:hypothetical protein